MKKYILTIDGMMCGMCEAHINDVVRKNANVKISNLNSNHQKKLTTFVSGEDLDIDKIVDSIKEIGYQVADVKCEDYEKKSLFAKIFPNKKHLK